MLAVNMNSNSFTTLCVVPVAVDFVHVKISLLCSSTITDALKLDSSDLITNTTYYHLIAILYDANFV